MMFAKLQAVLARALPRWQYRSTNWNYTRTQSLVTAELGICSKAAPAKRNNEDAWSVFPCQSSTTIAVADGVSSWKNAGINPSLFPNQLVSLIAESAEAHSSVTAIAPSPSGLLTTAFDRMKAENKTEGSCTVCIAVIDRLNRNLVVANVGDCGLLHLRKGEILHKSDEQYLAKNVPYQLGIDLSSPTAQNTFQSPCDANVRTLQLMDGDLVIMATDGLFDNLWDDEIAEHISLLQTRGRRQRRCLKRAAEGLVFVAHRTALHAMNSAMSRKTPYMHKSYGDNDDDMDFVIDSNADDVTVCLVDIIEQPTMKKPQAAAVWPN